jgi:hypothetical protein
MERDKRELGDLPELSMEDWKRWEKQNRLECEHFHESRNKPDEDMDGYVLKVRTPSGRFRFTLFCEECVRRLTGEDSRILIVAASPFALISEATARRELATECVVPVSEYGKKMFEEVRGTTMKIH